MILLKTNRIEIQVSSKNIIDQREFEANTTITIKEDSSTPGLTQFSINKYPITQFLKFVSYTPATNSYTYIINPSTNLEQINIYQYKR